MYPLAYDPRTRNFHYDVECPVMAEYTAQLGNPTSAASAHLARIQKEVLALEMKDPLFLENNFAVDSDYFELQKLKHEPLAQSVAEKAKHPVFPRNVRGSIPSRLTVYLDRQIWTPDNLWVIGEHNKVIYYTPRWDALCPYIDVNKEMLDSAPKPFLVYAVPPESAYGVPVKDSYGLANVSTPDFWKDPRRSRKFGELEKQYRKFDYSETVAWGRDLTLEDIQRMGGKHFKLYEIGDGEVAGFVDYIRDLEVVILRVYAPGGGLVLTDVSIVLPERNQIYGSFCQWDRTHKNRSPGIYACLLACKWAVRNGYQYYNLGPVGDFRYKDLFVTDLEPLYGLALTDMEHPLVLDQTSPLHVDFAPPQWNQLYRDADKLRHAIGFR